MRLADRSRADTDTWCPLCSEDTEDGKSGMFYYVEDIPYEKHHIQNKDTWPRRNFPLSWWVCEKCCKREGLVW